MDFSFMCKAILATKDYGLWVAIFALAVAGLTAPFTKGNGLVITAGVIVTAVLLLNNLTTIAGWIGLRMSCPGL